MQPEQTFKEEYEKTAIALTHFLSWEGYGQNKGFHHFHVTTKAMKIDRLLGMPWRINLPDNTLYVSFSGVARNERNNTGEIRFSSPDYPGKMKKDFDNAARYDAPERLGFIRMHLSFLRDANNPDRRPEPRPDWSPCIEVTDMPDEEEKERRYAQARANHEQILSEMADRYKFYDDILAVHDRGIISGAQALYTDVQKLVRQEAAETQDLQTRYYYDWLDRYLEAKKAGKADKDILPLKLDIAESEPASQTSPAPGL